MSFAPALPSSAAAHRRRQRHCGARAARGGEQGNASGHDCFRSGKTPGARVHRKIGVPRDSESARTAQHTYVCGPHSNVCIPVLMGSCKQQRTDCTSGTSPFLYSTPSAFDASDQAHAIGVRWLRRDLITSAAGGPLRGATGAPCRAPAVACVCGAARATRHGAGAVRPIGPAAAPAARRGIASARPDAASPAAAASGPASGLASRRRRPASACRRRPRWRARSAAPGLELGPGLGLESVLRRSGRS